MPSFEDEEELDFRERIVDWDFGGLSLEETEKECLAFSQSTTVQDLCVHFNERAENGHLSLLRNALEKNESLLKLILGTVPSRTDLDTDELIRALALNKSVRDLSLESSMLDSQEAIETVLKTNTLLTRLYCVFNDSPTHLWRFIDGLRANSSLEVLDLAIGRSGIGRSYRASPFEAYSIVHVLETIFRALTTGSCKLKSLRLSIEGAWSETMASEDSNMLVNNMVQACTVLEKLELHRFSSLDDYLGHDFDRQDVNLINATRLRDDAAWQKMLDAVLPGICGSCSIQALSLNIDNFTGNAAFAVPKVIRMLTNKSCPLVTIKMNVKMCSTEQIEDIAVAALLSSTGKLRELELKHFKISSRAVEILLASRLTALGLSWCMGRLGERATVMLSEAMGNDELPFESLKLKSCNMGDDEATAFAQAIPHCSRLKHINLGSNRIGDAGARALGDMFPQTETLKSINLDGNRFGPIGCRLLVAGLENNTSIEELTGLPDRAQQARADHLTALNRAGRRAYTETTNMDYDEWFEYVMRFDSIGDLSAVYFAVRSKPDKCNLSKSSSS